MMNKQLQLSDEINTASVDRIFYGQVRQIK